MTAEVVIGPTVCPSLSKQPNRTFYFSIPLQQLSIPAEKTFFWKKNNIGAFPLSSIEKNVVQL